MAILRFTLKCVLLSITLGSPIFAGWWLYQDSQSASVSWLTDTVKTGSIEIPVPATGTLEPSNYVDVGAQVSGQIKTLHVSEGDVVKKGQLLAESQLERDRRLNARSAVSDDSLKQSETDIVVQRAKLAATEAELQVDEAVRPKYACRQCDQTGTSVQIKQRVPKPSLIPKDITTPSLLAQIITGKYQYALPLYRQEALFKQYGIELSRQTMSDWIEKCAIAIQPIYDRLHEVLLEQPAPHAGETTLNVVKEAKTPATCGCIVVVLIKMSHPPKLLASGAQRIVLYDFQLSRSGQRPKTFLKNYQGYLQVDGYGAYERTDAQLVGCWAHARRYFKYISLIFQV